jgi:hypothetical protein
MPGATLYSGFSLSVRLVCSHKKGSLLFLFRLITSR